MALKTDYKDDIPKTENRRYQMINNSDGTVSFVDVTEYTQVGDTFGAGDINATNESVNGKAESTDIVDHSLATKSGFAADALAVKKQFDEQNKNLTASDNLKFKFGKDGDGNYGYYGADGSLIPFKGSKIETVAFVWKEYAKQNVTYNYVFEKSGTAIITVFLVSTSRTVTLAGKDIPLNQVSVSYKHKAHEIVKVNEGDVFSLSAYGGDYSYYIVNIDFI